MTAIIYHLIDNIKNEIKMLRYDFIESLMEVLLNGSKSSRLY